jgi:CHASE2 domain-containing sensor protein
MPVASAGPYWRAIYVMPSLFISHSHRDEAEVLRLREWMGRQGVTSLFLQYGIPAGAKWEAELYSQLRRCDAVLFVGSPASVASRWCFAELAMARSLGKTIIPATIAPEGQHPLLADTQAIDLAAADGQGRLGERLVSADLDPTRAFDWDPRRSPFPGLHSFEERDAGVFFGRQPEIEQLLELLRSSRRRYAGRLVAVVGPSGSGKSSLVRAGLIPRLRLEEPSWLVLPVLRPAGRPVRQLALVLADAFRATEAPRAREQLEEALTGRPDVLIELAEELGHLSPGDGDRPVPVFVDQAEELVTLTGSQERDGFLSLLRGATRAEGSLWSVLTLRSEFLSAFLNCEGGAQLIDDELLVGPLDRSRVGEVIERPADRAGVDFTPGLVARMVEDTAGGDALPLLAHTLAELYERAHGPRTSIVTDRQYDDLGGVVGALQRSADRELRRLDERGLAEGVIPTLSKLVAIGPDGQLTRRRLPRRALSHRESQIVDAFIEARLLTSNQIDGDSVVEVAHEALLRQWPPLRDAIERHHDELLLRSEIDRAGRDWERAGRRDDYLLTGQRLEAAMRLATRQQEGESHFDQRQLDFLAASGERQRRAQAAKRRPAVAVIALAAVAIGLALYLWDPEPVQRLELSTIDTRFSIRGSSAPDPRVVMVVVDDRTLRRFGAEGTGVLPRAEYAPILERLHQDDAAAIAIDVRFEGRSDDPRGDRALLDAIRATHDRLVLAFGTFAVVPERGPQVVRAELLGRSDEVRATGVTVGYAGLPVDTDDGTRRAEYDVVASNLGGDEVTMPTFAFAAADVARRAGLVPRIDRDATASRRASGGQTKRTTWIDYRGPGGTFRRVSAIDIIDGRVPAGSFRNKAVVIAVPAADQSFRTPLDSSMPGAEVHANALATMLRGEPLRDASPLLDILAIIMLASLPAVAGLTRSRRTEAAVIAAVAVAFLAAAQLAFQGGWIIAVIAPLAALVAAASGVAALGAPRNVVLRTRRP